MNSISLIPCRSSSNAARPRANSAAPYGVVTIPFGVRSSRRTPSACSREAITSEIEGVDIGRIGALPSLLIFTEGNHLMVLSSDDIVGAFPSWARSQPQYVDLDLTNIILVTLPQPILVQMMYWRDRPRQSHARR